jgi:DNA-binding transcriptional regulator of glucitol operon
VRRLVTPRWLLVHAGVVVAVVTFLALGWWQVRRAAEGNLLSFGYAVEWPVFAAFVIFVWVREVRAARRRDPPDAPSRPSAPARPRPVRSPVAQDDGDDPQLAAYNRYLAWLNENPQANPRDYPGWTSTKEA